MGLRSDYLQRLASLLAKDFQFVLPCDFFKRMDIKKNECYICNLSDSESKGTHFVAIRVKHDKVLYFDSFGRPCNNKDILEKLKLMGFSEITYCMKNVQYILSEMCGFFCLSFLLYTENHSAESFLDLFNETDLKRNDDICVNIIKEHIRYSLK